MKLLFLAGLLLGIAVLDSNAQDADQISKEAALTPRGEVIINEDGSLRSPWRIVRVCAPSRSGCSDAIVNSETREIAKVGNQWASPFRSSGKLQEVRRISEPPYAYVKGRSSHGPEEAK